MRTASAASVDSRPPGRLEDPETISARSSTTSDGHPGTPDAPRRRPDTFCRIQSKQSHTTNPPRFLRIHYRYHPLFGKELEVVHKRDSRSHQEMITQLPDGTRCVLPGWMFDESYCLALPEATSAVISIQSLIQLAELLASQEFAGRGLVHDSTTPRKTSSRSARTHTTSASASNGERSDGGAQHPASMRRTARRTVGSRHTRNSHRRTK